MFYKWILWQSEASVRYSIYGVSYTLDVITHWFALKQFKTLKIIK